VILLGLLLLHAAGEEGRAQEISDSLRVEVAAIELARPDTIPTSSGRGLNSPFWIMMRSFVVPGLGQLSNGKFIKAAVVAAGEGYLISRIVQHERERRRFLDKAEEFPEEASFYEAKAENEAERRKDFTWWTALAAAISMADAFVDAHLRHFKAEFKARDAGEDEPSIEFKVGMRFRW
jgi:uncharacterized protein YfiM (DUF2279 family)